jgi:hypothetical protein
LIEPVLHAQVSFLSAMVFSQPLDLIFGDLCHPVDQARIFTDLKILKVEGGVQENFLNDIFNVYSRTQPTSETGAYNPLDSPTIAIEKLIQSFLVAGLIPTQ